MSDWFEKKMLDEVMAELKAMSKEDFQAAIESHKDGDIAQLLLRAWEVPEDTSMQQLQAENTQLRSALDVAREALNTAGLRLTLAGLTKFANEACAAEDAIDAVLKGESK